MKIPKHAFLIVFLMPQVLLIPGCTVSGPASLDKALEEAGDNRVEIMNAIRHFREQDDPEKLVAAEWIVSNMRGKSGYDSLDISTRVAMFRELTACRDHGKETVDSLARIYGRVYQQSMLRPDLATLDSAFLVDDIEAAFLARRRWPWAKTLDFATFRDFVLPYRVADEAVSRGWRRGIQQKWMRQLDSIAALEGMDKVENAVPAIGRLMQSFEWNGDFPSGPRLGAAMTDLTVGDCLDYADRVTFFFRAAGIPCTTDRVPVRGNGNAPHFWAAVIGEGGKVYIYQDSLLIPSEDHDVKFLKVNRECFSGDRDVTAGYLSAVTRELSLSGDVLKGDAGDYYLCASSRQEWIPVARGKRTGNGGVGFGTVATGRVAMAGGLDSDGKVKPVYGPFLITESGIRLIRDNERKGSVSLFRKYTPEIGEFADRMVGGVVEVSDNPAFSDPDTILTIANEPFRLFTKVTVSPGKKYRYVRYRGADNSYCNIAELELYPTDGSGQKLTGKPIGTDMPWGNVSERGIASVFDGDPYTSFDYMYPSGGWVGLDFGRNVSIGSVVYAPRNRDNFIREGDTYELFYWDTDGAGWSSLGSHTARSDSLVYDNVPTDALLYLRNHTRGKDERIFMYDVASRRQIFY